MGTPREPHPKLSFDWIEQPDDITCGPSCLAMAHAAIARRHGLAPMDDVLAVGAMCGTNPVTGTTAEGLAVGVRGLGLDAVRHVGGDAFDRGWRAARAAGAPVLLRTLTQGIKHWVLATEHLPDGGARCLDPWLGRLDLSRAEVEALVAPREHEIWVLDPATRPRELRMVGAGDVRHDALRLLGPAFAHLVDEPLEAYLDAHADWDLSRALLVDGRVAGVYLLKEGSPEGVKGVAVPSSMEGLRAVEGVALVAEPVLRGRGYGRLLRDLPRALGYEMAWGFQHKALANLEAWRRRRELIGDTGECWVTAEALPVPEPAAAPAP